MRISILAVSGLLAAGGLVAFACSGPSSLGKSTSSDASVKQEEDGGLACSDFAAAKCAKFDSCTQGMYTQVNYGSAAVCQSREELACLGILSAPGNTATPNGFEQCGKDLTTAACADFFEATNLTPACTPQVGPRANGQSCVNNGQCQSTWCYAANGAACGICATRPAAGATCAANVDCGGNGMLCSVAKTCAPAVAIGGACSDSLPCTFALSCVGATATATGTCQTAGTTVGAACDGKRVAAPLCNHDDGLFCPSATGKCAQSILVDAGSSCGITPGKVVGDAAAPSQSATCNGGSACEPSTATLGTCIAPAADGAECDTVNGPPCLAPARCVGAFDGGITGTCAILETTTACN